MGVTDQLVHQHVARERYLQAVMQLETEVRMRRFTSVACEMQPVCQPQSFEGSMLKAPLGLARWRRIWREVRA